VGDLPGIYRQGELRRMGIISTDKLG